MIDEIRNKKDLVGKVLRDVPDTRDSDRLLILEVWEREGLILNPIQREQFMQVSSTETIRRVRQKYQEEGLYPAQDKIKKERDYRSWEMQQVMPSVKPKLQYDQETNTMRMF